MMRGLREEFEKDIKDEFISPDATCVDIALLGARWMAERCAKYISEQSLPDAYSEPCLEEFAKDIRELAKELS